MWAAGIAPFVGIRIGTRRRHTRLAECRRCEHRFFEHRYDDAEIRKLYADYRGTEYFEARNRREPWYTRRLNEILVARAAGFGVRKAEVAEMLGRHAPPRGYGSVLDYGGDRGQYLPEGFGNRFVFDISGVVPEPGVHAFANRDAIGGRRFGAVFNSNVLEHVSDVADVVAHMRSLVEPGGLLFVEVPEEHYGLTLSPRDGPAGRMLAAALHLPVIGTALDFYGTAARVKLGMVPPLAIPRIHEHINYFTVRSLRLALEGEGFRVLQCDRRERSLGKMLQAIACVAGPAPENSDHR
jgi:SAM-dependent methyltransferase